MIDFIIIVFASYAITLLAVNSDIIHHLRCFIIKKTPFLRINDIHMLECRMCVGFWISLILSILFLNHETVNFLLGFLSIYGASYFISTQER